jgi:hypothetical protein
MKLGFIVGTMLAFLAGALTWVLPPYLLGRIVTHYPETAWPWLGDGIWNMQLLVSLPVCLVIGFVYGLLFPKHWYLSFLATWWIVPFNFLLDVTQFPTSHNLWPFEMIMFALYNIPTLVAASLGKWLHFRFWPEQAGARNIQEESATL